MTEHDGLAQRFEANRAHLSAVAYRMLGSRTEAEDAVQEAWLRLSRAGAEDVENLGGWLTTVVARVCLDVLRSRKARREQALDERVPEAAWTPGEGDPEHDASLAEAMGPALLVVLDTLAPAERLAFVLHDMFAVPFEEVARMLGRSPVAVRQLASRARRRVQGTGTAADDDDRGRSRAVVDAFLAASREGRFDALLSVLDPDVVLVADATAVALAARAPAGASPIGAPEVRGAHAVATSFAGRARAAKRAMVDGQPGLAWGPARGDVRVAFAFTVAGGKVVAIDVVAEPERLAAMDVVILPDDPLS
jgi:RNA polymerase sigma-70 factor (ECF subfamily)